MVIEWGLLDAQHFGIPQRRRRVFVIAIFNSATATNCPSPLLPVGESLRRDTSKGKQKRQSAALTLTEGVGAGGGIVNAIGASIYHKSTVVNQDVNSGHLVTEHGILGSDIVGSLNTSDAKMISTQYVNENKVIVEPHIKCGGNTPMLAIPIQDGREIEKNQNGFGIAEAGSPAYTLDQTGAQAVAIGIQGNVINRQDHNGPAGKGHTEEGDPMFTLTKTDIHAVATPMAVRRLTPLECERLMGWPDDYTRYKADGTEQTDTHRYKQCGNGVASPVAEWIGKQLMKINQ